MKPNNGKELQMTMDRINRLIDKVDDSAPMRLSGLIMAEMITETLCQ